MGKKELINGIKKINQNYLIFDNLYLSLIFYLYINFKIIIIIATATLTKIEKTELVCRMKLLFNNDYNFTPDNIDGSENYTN